MILAATSESSSLIPVLVGAGISASVSFAIFVLTQLWLYHKGKSDVLREKLEELWKSLSEVKRRARPFNSIDDRLTPEVAKALKDNANILLESILLPTPFVALYFPDLSCKFHLMTAACGQLVKLMKNPPGSELAEGDDNAKIYAIYENSIEEPAYFRELQKAAVAMREEITDFQVYLRENQGSLIKTPKHAFRDWVYKISGQEGP